MNRNGVIIIICICVMCSPLYANAGSPMMYFGIFHLLFINLLIGIAETKIIKSIYKIEFRYLYLIAANYLSMFIGLVFVAPYFSKFGNNYDFWTGQTSYGSYDMYGFYIGFLAAILFSIIFELPFFILSNKNDKSFKIALKYSAVANMISNAVMFVIYFAMMFPGSK